MKLSKHQASVPPVPNGELHTPGLLYFRDSEGYVGLVSGPPYDRYRFEGIFP
jgi:hypothetical protein